MNELAVKRLSKMPHFSSGFQFAFKRCDLISLQKIDCQTDFRVDHGRTPKVAHSGIVTQWLIVLAVTYECLVLVHRLPPRTLLVGWTLAWTSIPRSLRSDHRIDL